MRSKCMEKAHVAAICMQPAPATLLRMAAPTQQTGESAGAAALSKRMDEALAAWELRLDWRVIDA